MSAEDTQAIEQLLQSIPDRIQLEEDLTKCDETIAIIHSVVDDLLNIEQTTMFTGSRDRGIWRVENVNGSYENVLYLNVPSPEDAITLCMLHGIETYELNPPVTTWSLLAYAKTPSITEFNLKLIRKRKINAYLLV